MSRVAVAVVLMLRSVAGDRLREAARHQSQVEAVREEL